MRTIWRGRWGGHGHTGAVVQSPSVGAGADRPTGAQQAEPLTLLAVAGVGHCGGGGGVDAELRGLGHFLSSCPSPPHPGHTFRLLVLMVQDHIGGMAQAPSQVNQGAVSKLVDLEDTVVDVSDAVDVVLEHINAEGVT